MFRVLASPMLSRVLPTKTLSERSRYVIQGYIPDSLDNVDFIDSNIMLSLVYSSYPILERKEKWKVIEKTKDELEIIKNVFDPKD